MHFPQIDNLRLPLADPMVSEGWIALFDGSSLYGWKAESESNWRVEDGEIRVDAGQLGLLRTTSQFSDFELMLEYRAPTDTNSGVFIRTSPRPTDPSIDCYEINIAPHDNPYPTGSIVARSPANISPKPDEFNRLRIVAQGARIAVEINGVRANDYRDDRPLGRGFIGLQFNSGSVRFRHIYLRPLNLDSLVEGRDLARWQRYPEMKGEFAINERGEIHVSGGPGQLETRDSFADFVLQLQAKTIGPLQNSGVFFRCVPGQQTNGYEIQIDNEMVAGKPERPANYGTGGIFRRQPARRVVSVDDRWFALTAAVCGPHISVWINGYQVVDWTDTRASHPNPRRGLRLEAGTLMLQAHDPATNTWFRNIRIAELSPRGR